MSNIIFIFLLLAGSILFAQPAQKLVRSGNNAYNSGHFKEAEIDYRKALTKSPGSQKATYNLGNSLYKQQNFGEAASQYQKLSESKGNAPSKASVYYNLGNSLLENKKYQESIEAYKKALRQDPADEDTRYNLSYAMAKLQQQKKDQNNQKQQQKQQQQQQKQQQQQQQKPNMSKQDADRMLNAMNNNEKRTLDKTKNKKVSNTQNQPEKDW